MLVEMEQPHSNPPELHRLRHPLWMNRGKQSLLSPRLRLWAMNLMSLKPSFGQIEIPDLLPWLTAVLMMSLCPAKPKQQTVVQPQHPPEPQLGDQKAISVPEI
jgi:hypothetical protein